MVKHRTVSKARGEERRPRTRNLRDSSSSGESNVMSHSGDGNCWAEDVGMMLILISLQGRVGY
jgi:hypothetical protein